jgi:hypothetical protein
MPSKLKRPQHGPLLQASYEKADLIQRGLEQSEA